MNRGSAPLQRIRAILDCFMIIIILLQLSANDHRASAGDLPLTASPGATMYSSSTISDLGFSDQGSVPISNQAVFDNNTLAAMIAAENAALTSPQYFIDLPLIIR